jgi:hypothetical protein
MHALKTSALKMSSSLRTARFLVDVINGFQLKTRHLPASKVFSPVLSNDKVTKNTWCQFHSTFSLPVNTSNHLPEKNCHILFTNTRLRTRYLCEIVARAGVFLDLACLK